MPYAHRARIVSIPGDPIRQTRDVVGYQLMKNINADDPAIQPRPFPLAMRKEANRLVETWNSSEEREQQVVLVFDDGDQITRMLDQADIIAGQAAVVFVHRRYYIASDWRAGITVFISANLLPVTQQQSLKVKSLIDYSAIHVDRQSKAYNTDWIALEASVAIQAISKTKGGVKKKTIQPQIGSRTFYPSGNTAKDRTSSKEGPPSPAAPTTRPSTEVLDSAACVNDGPFSKSIADERESKTPSHHGSSTELPSVEHLVNEFAKFVKEDDQPLNGSAFVKSSIEGGGQRSSEKSSSGDTIPVFKPTLDPPLTTARAEARTSCTKSSSQDAYLKPQANLAAFSVKMSREDDPVMHVRFASPDTPQFGATIDGVCGLVVFILPDERSGLLWSPQYGVTVFRRQDNEPPLTYGKYPVGARVRYSLQRYEHRDAGTQRFRTQALSTYSKIPPSSDIRLRIFDRRQDFELHHHRCLVLTVEEHSFTAWSCHLGRVVGLRAMHMPGSATKHQEFHEGFVSSFLQYRNNSAFNQEWPEAAWRLLRPLAVVEATLVFDLRVRRQCADAAFRVTDLEPVVFKGEGDLRKATQRFKTIEYLRGETCGASTPTTQPNGAVCDIKWDVHSITLNTPTGITSLCCLPTMTPDVDRSIEVLTVKTPLTMWDSNTACTSRCVLYWQYDVPNEPVLSTSAETEYTPKDLQLPESSPVFTDLDERQMITGDLPESTLDKKMILPATVADVCVGVRDVEDILRLFYAVRSHPAMGGCSRPQLHKIMRYLYALDDVCDADSGLCMRAAACGTASKRECATQTPHSSKDLLQEIVDGFDNAIRAELETIRRAPGRNFV